MITAILLAAGESKRMNGENKLIKKIYGKSLIEHSVKNILESSIDELIIIIGHQSELIKNILSRHKKIKFIFNNKYKTGMASSIQIGLNNLSKETQSFFICLGDMPNINKQIYNSLIKSKNSHQIIIPTYKGQSGNPVLFDKSMKEIIINIEGDNGAKKIINMHRDQTFFLETNDQSIIQDFNTHQSFY